jgi:hypothetical protein
MLARRVGMTGCGDKVVAAMKCTCFPLAISSTTDERPWGALFA